MNYYRCRCGKQESWSNYQPADCDGCESCGSNMSLVTETHKPLQEHSWKTHYTASGKPYERCTKCNTIKNDPSIPNHN